MTLTLVVPDLLWPRQVMHDVLCDADFPALQVILGKGHVLPAAHKSVDTWWCSHFSIAAAEYAAAPLRLTALGIGPGGDRWLCADPVHLRVDRSGIVLTNPALLDIDTDDARQLHTALAPLFDDVGEVVMASAACWHLRLKAPAPSLPARLNVHIEQAAAALLPKGDDARSWRQLINEAQMTLHAHPVNTTRVKQGKVPINSIALWGEGRMYQPKIASGTAVLLSNDLIAAGAAQLAAMTVKRLPPKFSPIDNDTLVYWDRLCHSTASRDALAWRDGLQQLERDWLAPALAALTCGELKRIELHGFGAERAVARSCGAFYRYRFWRQPRRLETL